MNNKDTTIFTILVISIGTAISGMAAIGLATPAFANDDHHGQKCKKNDDNNCNHDEIEQKAKGKNDCEIKNENKDQSDDNTNDNDLECINSLANIDDSILEDASIFDVPAD
jgi:hypothetical protein